jgi:hypothetical protein
MPMLRLSKLSDGLPQRHNGFRLLNIDSDGHAGCEAAVDS